MIYIKSIELLDEFSEHSIASNTNIKRLDNTVYPLHIFPAMELSSIDFSDITIFCGGNGSGKSTLLNIIAGKLEAYRKSSFNKGMFFDEYVRLCEVDLGFEHPIEVKLLTSDDVFDYMIDIRAINHGVNREKELLTREFLDNKYTMRDVDFEDFQKLKDKARAMHKTMSAYTRERLVNTNIPEHSNGESALLFWEREINENSIYILDEPENSLSIPNQIKLAKFIFESVRFYNCQFIISTHSPFLLALEGAKVYDLDSRPCVVKPWHELDCIKLYYDFFIEHKNYFN